VWRGIGTEEELRGAGNGGKEESLAVGGELGDGFAVGEGILRPVVYCEVEVVSL
jgi:hypothetical protein